jgi:actin-like ATPase involved in cell morphogenesis
MYRLGVDLGTTFSAAAVRRGDRAEICALGTHVASVPSVVLVRDDGTVLTGEAAARRALVDPSRVAREFKRRLGDTTPLLLGGAPYPAEVLTGELLRSLVRVVVEREGEEPESVCLTHPANWGTFKVDLLRRAVEYAGLTMPVSFLTEPEAAALSYARQQRVDPGNTVAVYDLGGGTFDAAVLRCTDTGFTILGHPEGIERLGGIDVDAAVYAHVVRTVGAPLADLDEDDPAAVAAVARLRAECVAAKEALSGDTDTTIPVLLPGYAGEVRLTRGELEGMVRPALYDTFEALQRALRSASVRPDDLTAVLLVGGSSRMPLVAQLIGAELGRPVALDTHPKHVVALGAAWAAGDDPVGAAGRAAVTLAPPPEDSVPLPVAEPAAPATQPNLVLPAGPLAALPATGSGDGHEDGEDDDERGGRRRAFLLGSGLGAEAGAVAAIGFEQGRIAATGNAGTAPGDLDAALRPLHDVGVRSVPDGSAGHGGVAGNGGNAGHAPSGTEVSGTGHASGGHASGGHSSGGHASSGHSSSGHSSSGHSSTGHSSTGHSSGGHSSGGHSTHSSSGGHSSGGGHGTAHDGGTGTRDGGSTDVSHPDSSSTDPGDADAAHPDPSDPSDVDDHDSDDTDTEDTDTEDTDESEDSEDEDADDDSDCDDGDTDADASEADSGGSDPSSSPPAPPDAPPPPALPQPSLYQLSPAQPPKRSTSRGRSLPIAIVAAVVTALVVIGGYTVLRPTGGPTVLAAADDAITSGPVELTTSAPPTSAGAPPSPAATTVVAGSTYTAGATRDVGRSGGGDESVGSTSQAVVVTSAPPPTTGAASPATATVSVRYAQQHTGVVTSADGRIQCPGAACSAAYPVGQDVTLTAAGEDGATWTGCASATGAVCHLRAGDGRSPLVTYPAQYAVEVAYQDRLKGTVASDDRSISCPGTCSATYREGTAVTLTASGQDVDGWSDCASSSGSTCRVVAGDGHRPTVRFSVKRTVTVAYEGRQRGTVASGDGRISCPGTCSADYPDGTAVTLTASGQDVKSWSDCASSSGATCRVVAGDGHSPTVTFVSKVTVSVSYADRTSGTVASGDGVISCPGNCSAAYPEGTLVTFQALGQRVDHWTGCAKSSGTYCTVTAGDGRTPRVYFVVPPPPPTTTSEPPIVIR